MGRSIVARVSYRTVVLALFVIMTCCILGLLTCRVASTLCSLGVSKVPRPSAESRWCAGGVRRRGCWLVRVFPARGCSCQVAVYQGDGGGAFADRGCDPFDRSPAHVTGCEHPRQAGFQRQRRVAGRPPGVGAGGQVRAGGDEPLPVAGDGLAEPFGAGLG